MTLVRPSGGRQPPQFAPTRADGDQLFGNRIELRGPIVLCCSAYPINSARSHNRLIRRGMPCVSRCSVGMASGSKIGSERAGLPQAVGDVFGRLPLDERPKQALHRQPLLELRRASQHGQHRGLGRQKHRQVRLPADAKFDNRRIASNAWRSSIRCASSSTMTACRPLFAFSARNRSICRTLCVALGWRRPRRSRSARPRRRPAVGRPTFEETVNVQTGDRSSRTARSIVTISVFPKPDAPASSPPRGGSRSHSGA